MRHVRVVVQARTSSRRLPGKALLPVSGYPAAILAALRVSDPAWNTVIATSDVSSDDTLAQLSNDFGIRLVRGPLGDVLGRFILATHDLPRDAIVVRMTGDNLFPDADLVRELIHEFNRRKCGFMCTWSPSLDVPYGLSVELFTVASLRQASKNAKTSFDREHVTPWIRRIYGVATYRPRSLPTESGRLRCTVDTFDDYIRICRVFQDVTDPIRISWNELCTRLRAIPGMPRFTVPQKEKLGTIHGQLVLGTAQLGGAYGVTNNTGGLTPPAAQNIVRSAIHHGVTHIDTARAYGASEHHIGCAFGATQSLEAHVVTKLAPLDALDDATSHTGLINFVDGSVFRSCRELRQFSLPTLLLHRAADRFRFSGVAWRRLIELKKQGVIGNLGVSVSTPKEALAALEDPLVRHLQIPFNILDWRWKEAGVDTALAQRNDVVVHARSPLLQGLLATSDMNVWPRLPNVNPFQIMCQLERMKDTLQRESVLELALAYVRSHPWIDGIVTGFERLGQLVETVRLFNTPVLDQSAVEWIDSMRGFHSPQLLDPACWPR